MHCCVYYLYHHCTLSFIMVNVGGGGLHVRCDTTKEHQDNVQNGYTEGVEEDEDWIGATVSLATKLDYRWIDLRVPSNQVILTE